MGRGTAPRRASARDRTCKTPGFVDTMVEPNRLRPLLVSPVGVDAESYIASNARVCLRSRGTE